MSTPADRAAVVTAAADEIDRELDEMRRDLAAVERELERAQSSPLACDCTPGCVEANQRNRDRQLRLLEQERAALAREIRNVEGLGRRR